MGNLSFGCNNWRSHNAGSKREGFSVHGLVCNRDMYHRPLCDTNHNCKDTLFTADEDKKCSDKWMTYPYSFQNLVLSGGGAKGYAYLGALKVRYELMYFSNCREHKICVAILKSVY